MKTHGQLIITDLLLYIIIITLIVGIIIGFTHSINEKQSNTLNHHEIDTIAQNTINTLTMNTGTPTNWQDENTYNIIIGLKHDENHSKLSYTKIEKLKKNPQLIQQLIPDNLNYELTLENNTHKQTLSKNTPDLNKTNIYVKSKPVKIDYDINITSINSNKNNTTCPLKHDTNYNCIPYTLNHEKLENGKYYLVSDIQLDCIITNTYNNEIKIKTNNNNPINDEIAKLIRNENQTIYIHIQNNNNTYLIYDTHNIKPTYNMINNENYVLKLKIY